MGGVSQHPDGVFWGCWVIFGVLGSSEHLDEAGFGVFGIFWGGVSPITLMGGCFGVVGGCFGVQGWFWRCFSVFWGHFVVGWFVLGLVLGLFVLFWGGCPTSP